MHVWLVQRAESTPHDDDGQRRPLRTWAMAERLKAAGHRVTWWTSTHDHFGRRQRFDTYTEQDWGGGFRIHYVPAPGYTSARSLRRFRDDVVLSRNFLTHARQTEPADRPDLIVASFPSVAMTLNAERLARDWGVPVVIDIRDLYPDVFADLLPQRLRPLVKLASLPLKRQTARACRDNDGIMAITERFVDWGAAYAKRPRRDSDRCFAMAYGRLDYDAAAVAKERNAWQAAGIGAPGEVTALFMGTFSSMTIFAPVIAAAERLAAEGARVRFVFCGGGAAGPEIEAACARLPNCHYGGWANGPRIQAALDLADIGLAPYAQSINYRLNIPNKPGEYMSAGLAIATNLPEGELRNLMAETGLGFGYDDDPEALAHQLSALAADPAALTAMKAASAATFAARYDADAVYTRMIAWFQEMAARRA